MYGTPMEHRSRFCSCWQAFNFLLRKCRKDLHDILQSHICARKFWLISGPLPFQTQCESMVRVYRCQVCRQHRSPYPRQCICCKRWVNPGCHPQLCLAQDGARSPEGPRPSVCKDCFVTLRQAIAPLARTLHQALDIIMRQNNGLRRYDRRYDVMQLHDSF